MTVRFIPIASDAVRGWQAGAPDAYGNAPSRKVSDGSGVPCRHCLKSVPAGAHYLVLAHRPFRSHHAYAETGPIFVCADGCAASTDETALPAILDSPHYTLRGYGTDEAIVYGTGEVVAREDIAGAAEGLLARPDVAFVHIRSAVNGCFQVRVERNGRPDEN